ncbi:pI215L [African swine fever virus]|uniref:Ubiquitin-conjugating enzyme E2 n=1 Tax=African swine fever virus TaxID=10497 RepID=A0A0C5AZJ5_ASF|nr:BA71V-I215L (k13L) [African swine fever virus]UYB79294.1 pI215L [Recombinant African swine fever virus]AJL34317.1 BA71V-I215L (k13L) [African swine fever virus]AXB49369.1 pI215L [African swine fever virus]AXB49543.1 pI215L [African swine fever virus]AXB49715.1 pI215L [African swine fever virus]
MVSRFLLAEYRNLTENPSENFKVSVNENNLTEWDVILKGPPDTFYEGGLFKAKINFPPNYPYEPPKLTFISEMWHPNIYADGRLCISILHTDNPEERGMTWSPAQKIETVLLSVISLFNEPNTDSPANVDAAKSYRKFMHKEDLESYAMEVKKTVKKSLDECSAEDIEYFKNATFNVPAIPSDAYEHEDEEMEDDTYILTYDDDEDEEEEDEEMDDE